MTASQLPPPAGLCSLGSAAGAAQGCRGGDKQGVQSPADLWSQLGPQGLVSVLKNAMKDWQAWLLAEPKPPPDSRKNAKYLGFSLCVTRYVKYKTLYFEGENNFQINF